MTRRMWAWTAGLIVLAAVDLGATVHAHASWHKPAGDSQATLSLGQLMGFVTAALLFAVAVTILVTGLRSWRTLRRRGRRADRIEPSGTDWPG